MEGEINDILLIEKLREHECLYNMGSQHYRGQNMRQEAWEEISNELNCTVEMAKLAWTCLRNCYINARKRRKTKSGQATTKVSKWKFEDEMAFLLYFLETRETESNLQLVGGEQENSEENSEELNKDSGVPSEEESLTENPHKVSCTATRWPGTKSKRNIPATPAEEMVHIMKQNAEERRLRNEIAKTKNINGEMDETDMFFLSMAKTVKRLSPIEQATIRMKICTLVSESEFREMRGQGHDVRILNYAPRQNTDSQCHTYYPQQYPSTGHSFNSDNSSQGILSPIQHHENVLPPRQSQFHSGTSAAPPCGSPYENISPPQTRPHSQLSTTPQYFEENADF